MARSRMRTPKHRVGRPTMTAAVMNPPLWRRPRRVKQLVLAGLVVVLVAVFVSALEVTTGKAAGMAPPAGYSAGQLVFDDQFSGRSLNPARWSARMGGQGDQAWNSDHLPAG